MPQKSDFFFRRTLRVAVLALPLTSFLGMASFAQGQGSVSRSSIAANNQRLAAEHSSAAKDSALPPTQSERIADEMPDVPAESPDGAQPILDEDVQRPIAMTPAEELAAKNKIVKQKTLAKTQGDMLTNLLERINDQEDRIRTLQGTVDVLDKQVKTMQAGFDKRLDDLKFQISHQAPKAEAVTASKVSSAPKPADESFASLIAASRQAKAQKNYKNAESFARKALAKAPKSGKLDAQYLLAQSLADQKVWSKAAVAYYDAYKLAPKSSVAPHALLGTALAMHALGDTQAACEAVAKASKEFPHPAPALKNEISKTKARYHC